MTKVSQTAKKLVPHDNKQMEVDKVGDAWRECDISDLCLLQRGFDITEATRKAGTIPVYSSSGLSYFHNEARVQPPAVITGRKGILGKVFYVEEPCWPHDTTLWVKDFKGNDPRFVYVFLGQFRLERFDAATSVPTLNRNNLRGIPIRLPKKPEQRAIAGALRDVDALLGALDQLIAKKRDLKHASMQQLLTGQTRLPGFYREWKSTQLMELARIQRGASPRPIDSPAWFDENSSVGWIRISDVTRSGMFLRETVQRLSALGVQHSRPIDSGSLIMSICATIGRPVITAIDACIHDGFVVFDNLQADKLFVYYLLKWIEPEWSKHGQTGSQMNLNTGLIKRTHLSLPPRAEQIVIAEVLSDMDAELTALEQRRAKTRALKQGMMQELLTGRTRLV